MNTKKTEPEVSAAQDRNSMISGNIARSLIVFALPMIIGNLFQQFYNIVDTIIVGKVLGQDALSAVGSTSMIVTVYVSVAVGFAVGCLIVFSQLYGAKNYLRMKTAIYTALITFLALGIFFMILGLAISKPILNVVVNDALMQEGSTYYNLYVLGVPALFIYNIANSGFNSLGKSRITLILLGGTSILNVILDLWFIMGLGWGVAGAAIATDISQYLSAVIALVLLLRHIHLNFKTEEEIKMFEWRLLGNMSKVAIPTMLAQVIVSVGYVALTSLVNRFSVDVISGYVAASKIDSICVVPMVQIGNSMATYTGQNVGAQKYERIPKGLKTALLLCACICAVFIVLIFIFGHTFIGWFMDSTVSEAAYTAGVQYMRITGALYFLMGSMYIICGVIRGAGAAMVSVIATVCNFSVRIAFAYIMVAVTGSELAIWWSNPVGWAVALTISFLYYKSGRWKTKRLADKV